MHKPLIAQRLSLPRPSSLLPKGSNNAHAAACAITSV
jgi:hypothetical protein